MDEIDTKILRRLLIDARSSYRKIAFELGISPPTVLNRITRLEKDEVIKSYSAMVDYAKMGFDLTAVIEVTVIKNKIIEVQRHISKFSNVCAVYDITGLTDLIIIAKFRNRSELSDFVKHDLSFSYIDRTNTHIVLITAKEDFRLL